MSFSIIPHTADIGFEACAETPLKLIDEAISALFSIILGDGYRRLPAYGGAITRSLELKADSLDLLLHDILEELLFWFEERRIVIFKVKDGRIDLDGVGCYLSLEGKILHNDSMLDIREIKAVTYYELEFKRKGDLWQARVILDL